MASMLLLAPAPNTEALASSSDALFFTRAEKDKAEMLSSAPRTFTRYFDIGDTVRTRFVSLR